MLDKSEFGERGPRDSQGFLRGWPRQEIQGSRGGSKNRDLKGENCQPEGGTQEERVWAGSRGRSTEPVSE